MEELVDYTLITEAPGAKATKDQLARLYQRYHFAKQLSTDKLVLEVACGSGIGLGYLAKNARKVVGGDIEEKNVNLAQTLYLSHSDITIDILDAHNLQFPNNSFDVVLLYEAIYYLKETQKFVSEAKRVLSKNGRLIICTVNKDWEDFHPSPYTHKYFSVPELYELLIPAFSEIKLYGAFPVEEGGVKNGVVSFLKRTAVNFNLIPGSLKARVYLKRIFMGKLKPLPEEVYENMSSYEPPIEITENTANKSFKIIYAVAKNPRQTN